MRLPDPRRVGRWLRGTSIALPASLLLAACGGGGAKPTPADAGVTDAATTADGAAEGGLDMLPSGAMVAAPMLPAPPVLTPCPDGWRTVMTAPDEPAVCEPWPASGYQSCPAAQAHLPGTPGCAEVGDPCPSGPFRADFPAGAHVLYVRAGAAAGGDGTEATPFATIADATAAATPGTVIALAAGDYDEAVVLGDGVELTGACAEQTHLTLTTPGSALATVTVHGTDATVRDLSISGAAPGLVVDMDSTAMIEGVAIEQATTVGLDVQMGSSATIDDLVVRDTQIDPTDHVQAWGISVDTGSTAVASRVAVERCGYGGIGVDSAGASLTLTNAVVRDTMPTDPVHLNGFGLLAAESATLTLDSVVVERATWDGLLTAASGRIDGTSVLVRDTQATAGENNPGYGLQAQHSSTVHLERSRLTQNQFAEASAFGPDSNVELVDSIVEDTALNMAGNGGLGVAATGGGSASLTRVLVRRATFGALLGTDPESRFVLTDVSVKDTRRVPADNSGGDALYLNGGASATIARLLIDGAWDQGLADIGAGMLSGTDLAIRNIGPASSAGGATGLGFGINANLGAQVDLTRVSIVHATGWGILAGGSAMTSVTLHDLRIDSTDPVATDFPYADLTRLGRGLEVQYGATVDVEHAVFSNNADSGVECVDTGTTLTLGDVVIRDTQSELATHNYGQGVSAENGGHITVAGALIERNHQIGVSATGAGSAVTLSDAKILDTAEAACAADTCADNAGGFAVVSAMGASITATRFLVARSATCGVQVASDAGLDLSNGEVSYNPIGANVQVPGFDINRISDHVVYDHNQSNLDSETLPVPAPTVSLPMM